MVCPSFGKSLRVIVLWGPCPLWTEVFCVWTAQAMEQEWFQCFESCRWKLPLYNLHIKAVPKRTTYRVNVLISVCYSKHIPVYFLCSTSLMVLVTVFFFLQNYLFHLQLFYVYPVSLWGGWQISQNKSSGLGFQVSLYIHVNTVMCRAELL